MPTIRTLSISGDPYSMGHKHGQAYAEDIAKCTEDRLRLCSSDDWALAGAHRSVILELAERCMPHHYRFSERLCAELEGISDGSGVPVAELFIMNSFTDFVDILQQHIVDDPGGCTGVLVSPGEAKHGKGFLAQTWDMHTGVTPYVLMVDAKPAGGMPFTTFTINGCIGMIGMNDAGIAIGANNLYTKEGKRGVTWTFVVRKMLAQDHIDAALEVLQDADLAGAHNYMLMGPDGKGYNVEASPNVRSVTPLEKSFAHSNHCLDESLIHVERPRTPQARQSTVTRLDQAHAYLAVNHGRLTVDKLMELTRIRTEEGFSICQSPVEGYDVETAGACIMSPATKEMWALWGRPSEEEYERFAIGTHTPQG